MKIPVLQLLIGGAGLVAAIPLRVVVVDGPIRPPPSVGRVGLAGAGRVHTGSTETHTDKADFGNVVITSTITEIKKPHCGTAKEALDTMKHKIQDITHEFADHIKDFFGFEVTHSPAPVDDKAAELEDAEFHILPLMPGPGLPKPSSMPKPSPPHLDAKIFVETQSANRHRMWMHRGRPESFISRMHKALNSLSPWEGRALSFVIGCGLGVLLRMLWVFTILAFRFFFVKPRSVQLPVAETPAAILSEEDADKESLLAPPEYEYDEKSAL